MILRLFTGRSAGRAFIVATLTTAAALGPAACRSAQPKGPADPSLAAPVAAPALATRVDHYIGTPLSGPTTRPAPAVSPATAYAVRVTMVALGDVPTAGAPLGG